MYTIKQTHVHRGWVNTWDRHVFTKEEFARKLVSAFADDDHYLIVDGRMYYADRVEFDDDGNVLSVYKPDDSLIDPEHPEDTYVIGDYRYEMVAAE